MGSKIQALIDKLCPHGVEFKPLWSVTVWDRKFAGVEASKQPQIKRFPNVSASMLASMKCDEGDVFLLSTGKNIGWTTEEIAGKNLCDDEVVSIPSGKSSIIVKYCKGKFVTSENRLATSADSKTLNVKYLYYCLQERSSLLASCYRGGGIQHPSMPDVLDIKIPVPPLPVQEEIVRILDAFAELTAELTAELIAELAKRKQQYQYYRDALLTFGDDVEWKNLEEEFGFIRNGFVGTIKPFFCSKENGVRYIEGTNIHNGIISDDEFMYVTKDFHQKHSKNELKEDDILMVQSGHVGESAVVGKKYAGSNCHALIIMSNNGYCNSKFINYYFQSSEGKSKLQKITTGGTVKHILASSMKNFKIPIPPLEEQQRIVSILDRFDTLCNSLTSGIPAEIALRQKQYEYYRNKLLDFRPIDAGQATDSSVNL